LGLLRRGEAELDQMSGRGALARNASRVAVLGDLVCQLLGKCEEPFYWGLRAVVLHIDYIADMRVKRENNT
jgi:hypothetical protein